MAKVPFSKSNKQEEDKTLLEPMLYLLKVPGKNVRKKLLSSFNVWTKVDEDKGDLISECIFNLVPSWSKKNEQTHFPQLFHFLNNSNLPPLNKLKNNFLVLLYVWLMVFPLHVSQKWFRFLSIWYNLPLSFHKESMFVKLERPQSSIYC